MGQTPVFHVCGSNARISRVFTVNHHKAVQVPNSTVITKMPGFSQMIVAVAMACLLSCVVDAVNNPSAVGTSTTACQFGWYYNNQVCLPCPPGTSGSYGFLGASPPSTGVAPFTTSLIYGGSCIACPGGSYGNGTIVI